MILICQCVETDSKWRMHYNVRRDIYICSHCDNTISQESLREKMFSGKRVPEVFFIQGTKNEIFVSVREDDEKK